MKILLSGICGFVGSTLAAALRDHSETFEIFGFDNFIRPGSELNRTLLRSRGIKVFHGDVRHQSDIDALPTADWVIDAAANPSVLAGLDGNGGSRQVMEHNLWGTVNLLEYCRRHRSTFTLLSTSRVYSIPPLASLPLKVHQKAFLPGESTALPPGASSAGVDESFSTAPPVSLYGSTKLASEAIALEYGAAFDFPVWINRCGVLAGPGQFGRADQGIFSFWINSWLRQRPLKYIGFGGQGFQVRDCLHPRDLSPILLAQQAAGLASTAPRILNLSGGKENSLSLANLSDWCAHRFGPSKSQETLHPSANPEHRPYDIGWMVLDSTLAHYTWNWRPATPWEQTLEEIAAHAEKNPHWLEASAP